MTTRRTPPTTGPLTIEWRPPAQVTPYETNPRLIPRAPSTRWPPRWPPTAGSSRIVVDPKGIVIVGHVRLLAAKQLSHAGCRSA